MHFSDVMPRTTICWMPREKTCVQFLLTSVIFTILLSVRSPMPPIYDLVQGLSSKRQRGARRVGRGGKELLVKD